MKPRQIQARLPRQFFISWIIKNLQNLLCLISLREIADGCCLWSSNTAYDYVLLL